MDKKINARKKAQRLARQRKMRNRRIALTICLMVAVCLVSVGGTIAWLTAESGVVTNTFTTGNIAITLLEHVYNAETGKLTDATTTANNNYKIYPGAELPKDPFVTVTKNSEDCYVFAYVKDSVLLNDKTPVATINFSEKWTKVGEQVAADGSKEYVYRYNEIVKLNANDQPLPAVFDKVTISKEAVTETNIAELENDTIIIKAYAHQSNATDQDTATNAALDLYKVTAAA